MLFVDPCHRSDQHQQAQANQPDFHQVHAQADNQQNAAKTLDPERVDLFLRAFLVLFFNIALQDVPDFWVKLRAVSQYAGQLEQDAGHKARQDSGNRYV